MRRTLRWLARLLPPDYVLASALLFYLIVEFLAWWVAGSLEDLFRPAMGAAVHEVFKLRDAALIAASCFYGIWRVVAFHPFYRPSYAEWLKLTPWTSRYPLPEGPIRLAAQDLIVAGILVATMHSSTTARQLIPVMLLTAHSMANGLALYWTGTRRIAYAIGFLLGLLVLASREPNIALAVAAATSLVAHAGIRRSLARFPWETPEAVTRFLLGLIGRKSELPKQALGYPYDGLSPCLPEPLPLRDGIALSLLPAWWAFVFIEVTPKDGAGAAAVFCLYLLPGLVIGRCVSYLAICRPPISLWGRIMTGRWILPGYDRALAAPLLATTLAIGLAVAGVRYHAPAQFVLPACIATVSLVTLTMGPSLRVWRLTGAYRLVPSRDRKNLIEL
jgi:hypothetical protein